MIELLRMTLEKAQAMRFVGYGYKESGETVFLATAYFSYVIVLLYFGQPNTCEKSLISPDPPPYTHPSYC